MAVCSLAMKVAVIATFGKLGKIPWFFDHAWCGQDWYGSVYRVDLFYHKHEVFVESTQVWLEG